jgi:hypothetical protein
LYNHDNVWGIADPPADWSVVANPSAASAASAQASAKNKNAWPYNLFSGQSEADLGRK